MNGKRSLKGKGFIALVSVALIVLLTVPMVSYALPQAVSEKNRQEERGRSRDRNEIGKAKGHNVPIEKEWVLNITASGTAVNITDPSVTKTAKITLNATVTKASWGQAKLNVTLGTVKIGNTVYSIKKGWGLIALNSRKINIHLQLTDAEGARLHVILKGWLTETIPSPFDKGDSVDLVFTKPQSKLAGKFFLDLSGTLTRVG